MNDLSYDREIAAAMTKLAGVVGNEHLSLPARGDWAALRTTSEDALRLLGTMVTPVLEVTCDTFAVTAPDGAEIELRWYTKTGPAPGSAVLYLHGGGMIAGNVELYDPFVRRSVSETAVPVLAVDYRIAPEHPHPTPVEDCYRGLTWLSEHARELGVDPSRLAVMGDSAGGGLAAAVALLARDRGLRLARQILIYPMLDDRTIVPDPRLVPLASWTYDNNWTGWSALLGSAVGGPDVPYSAAPARATDLCGVAPADLEVGALDIFRDETVEYARRLHEAGVTVDLHVFRGAPHGFDFGAPDCTIARIARSLRHRSITSV